MKKGFTIIELIVVIAIIAILASVVMINVTPYINKAKDTAISEELHSVQANVMSNYISGNGIVFTALDVCAGSDGTANGSWAAIKKLQTTSADVACSSDYTSSADGTKFCACVENLSGTYDCVDNTRATVNSAVSCLTACGSATGTTSGPVCP